ncbi:hypothetical protein [Paenibacillus sp. LHD-38]|uniref:hypothetical protein n=1 Tax=Paenibacillus sp. LHD-38 TaxID=3072143 RepID=UPI00280E9E23|nr:hypothetical protein [Paenibacillus sp. LHD-38]MDQ8736926.1 hypothetical protein [Paenibacillus sp. LHD-38]
MNDSKDGQAVKEKKAQVIQQQIRQLQQAIAKQRTKASSAGGEGLTGVQASVQTANAAVGAVANSDRMFDMRV